MAKRKTTYKFWGRQCGSGWNDLIRPLEEELFQLGGTISQIKEKFGQLSFHYSLPRKVPRVKRIAFARLVREAEAASLCVCEKCGQPGELINDRGYYFTACTMCRTAKLDRNRFG